MLRLDLPAGSEASAIEQRRADVLLSPPAAELPALATHYPSQLASGPLGATVGLALNTRAWPFKARAARQAVSYAIDRKRLIDLVGGPLAAEPTCQILPPGQPGYQPYCPYTLDPGPGAGWTAPDLARAEHLVSISGTRGARVIVLTGESGTSMPGQAAGRFLVSMLDQLGYRASLQAISDSVAYGRRLATPRQRPQVGWVSWSQDYPAPSDFLSPLLTCGSFVPGRRDAAGYCNRRIGRQVAQARALQSHRPGTAEALWSHIDHELADEVPWVPLFNPRSLVMLSSRVGNYKYDPYGAVLIDQLWVTGPSGGPAGQAARERPSSAGQR